jgi:hypothetical protein
MPLPRRFANALSSGWASAIAGQSIRDSQCGFRLFRREVLQRTPLSAGRYEVESEMVVRAARLGFRFVEVSIPTVYEGESHLSVMRDVPRIFWKMMRLTLERIAPPPELRRALREQAGRT